MMNWSYDLVKIMYEEKLKELLKEIKKKLPLY